MKNEKAIELLEKDVLLCKDKTTISIEDAVVIGRAAYDQLLALLRQQPEAGEWTRKMRTIVGISESQAILTIREACSRLDAAEAKLEAYYNIFGGRKVVQQIKDLEAELASVRKELKQKTHLLESKP